MRRLGLLLAALLVAAGLTTVAPAPAAQAAPSRAALTYERQAHSSTNYKRKHFDRRPLTRSSCLNRMARAQAARMARRQQLFHQDLGNVQRQCGMGWVGENLAYGYPNGRAVVRAWMGSRGHRANILNRNFRQEGLGAVKRGGRWYVAQVFGTPS